MNHSDDTERSVSTREPKTVASPSLEEVVKAKGWKS
jgi:hypothetical protein